MHTHFLTDDPRSILTKIKNKNLKFWSVLDHFQDENEVHKEVYFRQSTAIVFNFQCAIPCITTTVDKSSAGKPLARDMSFHSQWAQIVHLWVISIAVPSVASNNKYVIVRINNNYTCTHCTLIASSESQARGYLSVLYKTNTKLRQNGGPRPKYFMYP